MSPSVRKYPAKRSVAGAYHKTFACCKRSFKTLKDMLHLLPHYFFNHCIVTVYLDILKTLNYMYRSNMNWDVLHKFHTIIC